MKDINLNEMASIEAGMSFTDAADGFCVGYEFVGLFFDFTGVGAVVHGACIGWGLYRGAYALSNA